MNIFHAVILSIVEGVTEFLPVSSTGHMILTAKLLHIPQTEFTKSFEIIIQLGAIMAVAVLYVRTLLTNKKLFLPLVFAFVPTAVIGFTLYPVIKEFLFDNSQLTALSLFVGGVFLVLFEKFHKPAITPVVPAALTTKQAIMIGLFQSISIVPGVSRAGATIIGGMITGMSRRDAVEFSFLLALPTMAAATALDIVKNREVFTQGNIGILLVGCLVAWVTAYVSVKTFLSYVKSHSLMYFGVYRIVVSLLFFLFVRS